MNGQRSRIEKKTLRRVVLSLCLGGAGDVAAIVLIRRGGEHAALWAAAVLIASMGLMFLLIALTVRAGRRALSARMVPLSSVPPPPLSARAASALYVQECGAFREGYYRVVEGPETYHFVRLTGGLLLDPPAELLEQVIDTRGTDAEIRARYRRGFMIPKAEIRLAELSFGDYLYRGQHVFCYGQLTLQLTKGRRVFWLLYDPDALAPETAASFFDAVGERVRLDTGEVRTNEKQVRRSLERAEAVRAALADRQDPVCAKRMRRAIEVLDVLSLAVFMALVFAGFFVAVLPRWVLLISLVLVLLPWVSFIAAPHYCSLIGDELCERAWLERRGVTLSAPLLSLFLPQITMIIVLMSDLFHSPLAAELWGVGIAAVLVLLSALRTPEARRYRSSFLAACLLMVLFGSGISLTANRALDWRTPETAQVRVIGREGDTLHLMDDQHGHFTLDAEYDPRTWEIGERAVLERHPGALGIEWEVLIPD